MSRLGIVLMGICAILLLSLLLAWYLSPEATANVKSVNFQTRMITLASVKRCGLTSLLRVHFDSDTEVFDKDAEKEVGQSELEIATRISFDCTDKGSAKKITILRKTEGVQSVDLQASTITLAGGNGCSSTQPPTVLFDTNTQLLDTNCHELKSSDLERATRISYKCAKAGLAEKITIFGLSEVVKWVDFQTGTITLTEGEGCGLTSPPSVQFDSKTQILDLSGRKIEFSDLARATRISFECAEKGHVKNITVRATSEVVQCIDPQNGEITLAGGVGCGSTPPTRILFDDKTQFLDQKGREVKPSDLKPGTTTSFECRRIGFARKITIDGTPHDNALSFPLARVVDSVVANTGQDRFSGVEGKMAFQKHTLTWKLDQKMFDYNTGNCSVVAGKNDPNYLRCVYGNSTGSKVSDLFEMAQETMNTYPSFRLDESRSCDLVRTYADPSNRVRVSVKACIPGEEPRDQVEADPCACSKHLREGVEVKECILTVEVIPTPH